MYYSELHYSALHHSALHFFQLHNFYLHSTAVLNNFERKGPGEWSGDPSLPVSALSHGEYITTGDWQRGQLEFGLSTVFWTEMSNNIINKNFFSFV